MQKNGKFKISKWPILFLAIIANSFIIVYSCLNEETTTNWNRIFTNLFTKVVNEITEKEVTNIPLNEIKASLSSKESYKYNYLSGYELNEIPLGSAKQIECSFSPADASNKSITYTAQPEQKVKINQNGTTASIVGMEIGDCTITARSYDGKLESTINIKVVDTIAPTLFTISLENDKISLGDTGTFDVDIDGGVLGHNELINFRYYDTRKLDYFSSDSSVASIDKFGVIYPHKTGSTTITITNGTVFKTKEVTICSGEPHSGYSNLKITGSNVCYSDDMLLNQNKPEKYHYQLIPMDGDKELVPEDFIWTSSNELLARVDKHGILRGFRKNSVDDEKVIISAKSKISEDVAYFEVTVKNQLPTALYHSFVVNGQTTWNQKAFTFSVGDNILVNIDYDVRVSDYGVLVETSDESVIKVTNEGTKLSFYVLKPGTCIIKITSIINPELCNEITCTVVKAGAITKDNFIDTGLYIRKSLGHAAVFMIAQIFTFLTVFMFLYNKKWWLYSSISLGEGLLISGLSELIQHFVPSRSGAFLDVLIDFSGVVVGAVLAFLIVLLIKKKRKRE